MERAIWGCQNNIEIKSEQMRRVTPHENNCFPFEFLFPDEVSDELGDIFDP